MVGFEAKHLLCCLVINEDKEHYYNIVEPLILF